MRHRRQNQPYDSTPSRSDAWAVHDAILFLTDIADKDATGDLVARIMERAAVVVVGGRIDVDRQWMLPGDNWRPKKGDKMWRVVAHELEGHPAVRGVR